MTPLCEEQNPALLKTLPKSSLYEKKFPFSLFFKFTIDLTQPDRDGKALGCGPRTADLDYRESPQTPAYNYKPLGENLHVLHRIGKESKQLYTHSPAQRSP